MKDLTRSASDKMEAMMPAMPVSDYPPGLSICLCEPELDKLDLDEMPEVGDMIHIRAMGKVTHVSDNESAGKRVEIQLFAMTVENEDTEGEDD